MNPKCCKRGAGKWRILNGGWPTQARFWLEWGQSEVRTFQLSIIDNPCHLCHSASERTGPLHASKHQPYPATRKVSPPESLLRALQLGQRSCPRGAAHHGSARRTAVAQTGTVAPRHP